MLVVRRIRGLGDFASESAAIMANPSAFQSLLNTLGPAQHVVPPPSSPMPMPGAPPGMPMPINGGGPTSVHTDLCGCGAAVLAHLTGANAQAQALMLQNCLANPAGFQQQYYASGGTDQMAQDCVAHGGTVATEWYKQPVTWILGGAIVIAGALVLKAAL